MKLPTIAWILIVIGTLVAGFGLLYGGFWALIHIPWLGSALALVIGFLWFRMDTSELKSSEPLAKAMMIIIFAAIGMALDQPGNPIYNKPLELFFCPPGTELSHDVERSSGRSGGVRFTQQFSCTEPASREVTRNIGLWEFFAVRFGEYLAIGYGLLGITGLIRRLRGAKQ